MRPVAAQGDRVILELLFEDGPEPLLRVTQILYDPAAVSGPVVAEGHERAETFREENVPVAGLFGHLNLELVEPAVDHRLQRRIDHHVPLQRLLRGLIGRISYGNGHGHQRLLRLRVLRHRDGRRLRLRLPLLRSPLLGSSRIHLRLGRRSLVPLVEDRLRIRRLRRRGLIEPDLQSEGGGGQHHPADHDLLTVHRNSPGPDNPFENGPNTIFPGILWIRALRRSNMPQGNGIATDGRPPTRLLIVF